MTRLFILSSLGEGFEGVWRCFGKFYSHYPGTAVAVFVMFILAIVAIAYMIKGCVNPKDPHMRSH